MVNIRRERHKFVPRGVQGGRDSLPCETTLKRANGEQESLPGVARFMIDKGDVIRVKTTGSGGFGPPAQRAPERVLNDVLDGRVSVQAAREVYGVVIAGDAVDEEATQACRLGKAIEGGST